jgi:hypothetical protein
MYDWSNGLLKYAIFHQNESKMLSEGDNSIKKTIKGEISISRITYLAIEIEINNKFNKSISKCCFAFLSPANKISSLFKTSIRRLS